MSEGMRFLTADVFTDRMFGGNQLAVFPEAEGLEAGVMQAIARELNISETVFVLPPADPRHTRKLRIFTPGAELPFAGHPTIGTAFVLASIGDVRLNAGEASIVFEEGVGLVPVTVRAGTGGSTYCELTAARLPEEGPPPPAREEIAAALSLKTEELRHDTLFPRGVSCGVPYLFVPLRDLEALARARLNLPAWERTLSEWWAPAVFPFTETGGNGGVDLRARMFAPGVGISEDPATGSAAAALAGYLAAERGPENGTVRWLVEQGVEMGRPSRLHVACDRSANRISAVRVGGSSVLVSEGRLAVRPRGRVG
ncbi:MAG TPA: PhzF family phenazine biosynthesis protein [Gemmatimonadales bacterium]